MHDGNGEARPSDTWDDNISPDRVEAAGRTPPQIPAHPISFGSGEWTRGVGQIGENRMVTVAKWRDGAIAGEHIWM